MTERKSLGQLMKDLQSHDFIQIHKSYVVNKKMIKEINSITKFKVYYDAFLKLVNLKND